MPWFIPKTSEVSECSSTLSTTSPNTLDVFSGYRFKRALEAIISFDRLLFNVEKNVSTLSGGYVVGDLQVYVSGIIRSYLPGRENPLATIHVEDSLYWSEGAENITLLAQFLPTANEAIRAAADYVGKNVPTSEREDIRVRLNEIDGADSVVLIEERDRK